MNIYLFIIIISSSSSSSISAEHILHFLNIFY
jgi:hypothetical protein